MHNDSIETLLLRHYGSAAPTPPALEQRLLRGAYQDKQELRRQQQVATRIREYRLSRRRAVRLVAIGSAGLGLLSVALESVNAIMGPDASQPAHS
ncbi:MAG: hypothetical protein J2P37_07000 [Ktedonobacteraceae bacterium]|nr:hypothetical protein [Ktedonobacteraceae bacterium]